MSVCRSWAFGFKKSKTILCPSNQHLEMDRKKDRWTEKHALNIGISEKSLRINKNGDRWMLPYAVTMIQSNYEVPSFGY